MKKYNKTPKLRFSGYTDDWEQRKLGDLVGIYDGVHQTPEYQDSGIMFLSVENIATLKSEKYISKEAFERDYKVYPEKGDILMTRIGDVGTTNVVETAKKVAFYVSLALLKPNGINSYFLSNAMKTNAFQKGLRERTLVTAIPQKINKDEIGKIDIFITNNDVEQQKIGAYFSTLDHLITLHQRKLEKLQNMKKSCLQKMFPRDGATVPEIRFSEFQGDWEERTLGSCFEERLESLPDGELLSVTIGSGIKKFSELDRHDNSNTDKSKYKRVCIGDIAYNSMRMWQGASGRSPYEGIVSPAYTVVKPIGDIDTQFFAYMFKKKEIIHLFEINSQGLTSDTWNLKYPAFSKIVVRVPRNVEEQSRIARFLLELDELISCTEQEIEITKRMKKGCLQKMFA